MPSEVNKQPQYWDHLFLDASDTSFKPPYVAGNVYLINGEIRKWSGRTASVYTPIIRRSAQAAEGERITLGSYAMLTAKEATEAVNAAAQAYNYGRGAWPNMTVKERITSMEKFIKGLKEKRNTIVELLMWEICKVKEDAEKEVDRTITYMLDTIQALKNQENRDSSFITDAGITGQIRRAPIGVVLCAGPFNYPFNETYTTLIPSLIMGNTVVMKLPRVGVACHFPTFELFRDCFPPGVVNIISGSGRETMPTVVRSGKLDAFAFIGTSTAADDLLKAHPKPHRLKVCLGLEAKNPAIILPDADIDNVAVSECLLGSLSYNGQRCTALKIIFVHESVIGNFLPKFIKAVDTLPMGLPWVSGVKITPLPEEGKPGFLKELIDDAISKGAKIANPDRGNKFDRTFVAPTILTGVTSAMRIYNEEQFGPLVPVVSYRDISEIYDYLAQSPYGQQAAVFGKDTLQISALVDDLVNQVARVNINTQCQRGPDSMPFTGRKDSAIGTLSVTDALRAFSVRSLVATKIDKEANRDILSKIVKDGSSKFVRMEHLF